MSEQPPKPEPGGEPGSGATAARRLYSCGNGDCIGSDAHREEVRKEGAREMREKAAMLLMRWVTSERGVLSLEPVELACLIRALPLTPEAPEPPKSDSGISSDAKSESIPVPEPPGAEKGSGCAYCIPAQPCPDHRPAPSPPTADVNDGGPGQAAYCHHRHHPDEHSSDFDTCPHPICLGAREAKAEWAALLECRERARELYEAVRAAWPTNGITEAMTRYAMAEVEADKLGQ